MIFSFCHTGCEAADPEDAGPRTTQGCARYLDTTSAAQTVSHDGEPAGGFAGRGPRQPRSRTPSSSSVARWATRRDAARNRPGMRCSTSNLQLARPVERELDFARHIDRLSGSARRPSPESPCTVPDRWCQCPATCPPHANGVSGSPSSRP